MALMARTRATAIPREVKIAVAHRDEIMHYPACVYCGRHAPADCPEAWSNAHFISRAQGGLGIEENILTLCPECHRAYDHTDARRAMKTVFSVYLRAHYPDWREEKLVYRKGLKHGGASNVRKTDH